MARFSLVMVFGLAALLGFAQSPPPMATAEGTVVAVVLDHLQLKAADGTVQVVVLPPGVSVTRRISVPWTNIHEGDWVGIDSIPGADGRQESVAINVFSPGIIARVRKGQFPMASGDLMTNAPVSKIAMGKEGDSLTLKNEGAMVPFKITDKTVVHRLIDASASALKPAAKVQVRGAANTDGSIQAANVSVLES